MSAEGPEVRTAAGTVRGRWEDGVAAFRGVPFAEPPVGELRFAAPVPARQWDGAREAAAFGPPPPQPALMGLAAKSAAADSDEWLTVNVWSPDVGRSRLPVMVWLYGGAYMMGHAGEPMYHGATLCREGVVVVTPNYRVGVEGFAQIEGAPANRGLLDQVAALEWVRENIAAFGGDPERVTVFGESAGAGSVAALMAMPRARGLFHRAIGQSVPGGLLSPELASDIAARIAAELELSPTLADLGQVAPERLVRAGGAVTAELRRHEARWGPLAHNPTPFYPVVDGDVLPRTPWSALAAGESREVELIAGHTRDEYRLFLSLGGLLGQVTEEQAATALRAFAPDAEAYREAYAEAGAEALFELVQSDWLIRMPTLHLAEAHTAGGGRTHLYELTWPALDTSAVRGSYHGLDIPLVFGNLARGAGLLGRAAASSEEAAAVSKQMRAAWTAFAATGDPGWPLFEAGELLTQVFDAEAEVRAYPEERSRALWAGHAFDPLPLR